KAYPTTELEVSIPALLSLMTKASSISDLVRFFSESPLDGLKGSDTPDSAPKSSGS
ncbi:MAG: alpha/beta hydrolase, partial [Cyanobacteria bacterium M_surface_9_m1_291]|nr:alpha/beta hydrolase [Cyanobacteria bacterium M_surface_9_m1_291]